GCREVALRAVVATDGRSLQGEDSGDRLCHLAGGGRSGGGDLGDLPDDVLTGCATGAVTEGRRHVDGVLERAAPTRGRDVPGDRDDDGWRTLLVGAEVGPSDGRVPRYLTTVGRPGELPARGSVDRL